MIRTSIAPSTPRPRTVSRVAPRVSLALASRPRRHLAPAPERVVYHGVRTLNDGALVVRVGDGPARVLSPRLDLAELSTAIEWGYPGQGPAQLAIALLADAIDDDAALRFGRAFYERVTSWLPAGSWTMAHAEVLAHARALGWRRA